eukprot:SAG11_NODE_12325_length_709_cov_0.731148_1_plen_74_part_00
MKTAFQNTDAETEETEETDAQTENTSGTEGDATPRTKEHRKLVKELHELIRDAQKTEALIDAKGRLFLMAFLM